MMKTLNRLLLVLIIALHPLLAGTALAAGSIASDPGIRISLLTAGPGAEIYQLEGHTALRIVHPDRGDYVVNWGLFDFAAPNFVYRFVKGETDYLAGAAFTEDFLSIYRHEGRRVTEQVLNLTPAQTEAIVELTDINLLPQNRVYRYNYVLDNCATRPLAIIERAIGDSLRFNGGGLRRSASFRDAMRHYHSSYPWYQFGIDLALGSGIDRPISLKEESFAPVMLETMLAKATLPGGQPVVSATHRILDERDGSPLLPPTPWYLTPLFWSFAVLTAAIIISISQIRRKSAGLSGKIFDSIFYSLLGLTGCVIAFLIFISVHEASSPNWLFLWINPLCFIAAVSVWSKRLEKLLVCYQFVNFALLIALSILLCCGVQSANAAFLPLLLADGTRALTCICTSSKISRCQHAKATH